MDIKKDYVYIILAYLFVMLYIIFVSNIAISVILVSLLLIYHIFTFVDIGKSGVIMVNEEGFINFANKDIKTYFGIDFTNKDYKFLIEIKPLYKFINQSYLLEKSMRVQIEYNNHYYDLINTPLFESNYIRCNQN